MKHSLLSDKIIRWGVPLVIIAFSIGAIYLTTGFHKMPEILKRGIQPSDFPRLVCFLIIALSLLVMWLDPVALQEKLTSTTWFTMAGLIIFALLMKVDLFIALGVFAAGMALLWGERRAIMIFLVGVLMPLGVFFFFDQVFTIRFPRGLLTSLWYG